jgi:hypothetical protein
MRVENQKFAGDVVIDHNDFSGCTFSGRLIYHGGPFTMVNCNFSKGVIYEVRDAARNTLNFFQMMHKNMPWSLEGLLRLNLQNEPGAAGSHQPPTKHSKRH